MKLSQSRLLPVGDAQCSYLLSLQLPVCAPVAVPAASPLLSSPPLPLSTLFSSLPSFNLHRLGGSPCNKCGGGRATSIQRAHFRTPRWRSDQLPSQANQCMWTVTLLTLKPSDRTD